MAKQEVQRRAGHHDDGLRRTGGVLFVKVSGDRLLVGLTGEGGPIEKFRKQLDVAIRRTHDGFPKAAVDLDVGGEQAIVGEEH